MPENKFVNWSHISQINAEYHSITISTTEHNYSFTLKQRLEFEELEQIHEFCRHYLGS